MTEPKYKLNKGHIIQKTSDKIIIYSGEKSVLYTLNDTAAYIFTGLKLGWSEEKIILKLIQIYNVSEKKAKKDFSEYKELLKKKKILISVNDVE